MALWKELENSVGKWIENADAKMREWGMPDIYVGYNSSSGPKVNISTNTKNPETTKPTGYSRNAARTANDIAQGGMTKDEIQEFNTRHPNETALIGG